MHFLCFATHKRLVNGQEIISQQIFIAAKSISSSFYQTWVSFLYFHPRAEKKPHQPIGLLVLLRSTLRHLRVFSQPSFLGRASCYLRMILHSNLRFQKWTPRYLKVIVYKMMDRNREKSNPMNEKKRRLTVHGTINPIPWISFIGLTPLHCSHSVNYTIFKRALIPSTVRIQLPPPSMFRKPVDYITSVLPWYASFRQYALKICHPSTRVAWQLCFKFQCSILVTTCINPKALHVEMQVKYYLVKNSVRHR